MAALISQIQHDAHFLDLIEEMKPRRPVVGEWVNCCSVVENGGDGFRRGLERFLAQVTAIDGATYTVRPWRHAHRAFDDEFAIPNFCIISRAGITDYSLSDGSGDGGE